MTLHVSPNRLEGSLCDTSLDRLLSECRKHLITGALQITLGGKKGRIELRAGAVDQVSFGGAHGERALEQLRRLPDGLYELTQRLPDLDGALGSAAALVADGDLELIAVMRHCEDHALSCTIRVTHAGRHGSIEFRAGEIRAARTGSDRDVDAVVAMKDWRTARIEVVASPLDLDIDGWPSVGRAPTAPFTLRDHARLARGTGRVDALVGRKTTVSLPPPPRAPVSLPRPRRALPPMAAVSMAVPEPLPEVLPRLPAVSPVLFAPRAPTAVRGSGTSGPTPAAKAPEPAPAKRAARPRKRKRGAPSPRTPAVPAAAFPADASSAHAAVSPGPMSAPLVSRSRPSVSHPAAVEARQHAAAAAYRSPRPIARRLAPPIRPPEPASHPRPPTRIHRPLRWVPLAIVLASVALAGAAALALVSGVI